ncbi:MAG TPA: response regulator, partial [Gammaproteobacteria bacterium]|nr:response regulator [Gammaproteobacteria bacterium]
MKENIKIYSCSLYPAQINKKLSVEVVNLNEIQDFDFDKDLLSIVLFEWNDYQKIAKRLKTFRDKNISLICIDDDISPDNRITLLNNDIEFISHKKFVQLGSDELNQWVKHAKYKVLIIEDNQALALNEAKLLRDSKFIVEISSPDSMSNLFDIGFAPDLILLDLNKTKDSDVADCVFSLTKHYENIPVLAMSDVQRPQQNNQLKSIGVDEILARNSQVDALISKILEMIQRKITHS